MLAGPAAAATVTAGFTSASDIPVTAAGYTAAGNEVDLSLGFAPTTGMQLMVVKNTELPFISGEFTNLAHGQLVILTYNGLTYKFVANYYGGSGNDLVLVRAGGNVAVWGNDTSTDDHSSNKAGRHVPFGLRDEGALAGKTVLSIAAGTLTSHAICSDGTIVSWSAGKAPEIMESLGVLAGKTVVSIAAGLAHNLAVCSDGTLAAWGNNFEGQIGDGTHTYRTDPVAVDQSGVLAGKSVVAAATGGGFSLAICSDGTIAAWGFNGYGQLGNGTLVASSVPIQVDTSGMLAGKTPISVAAGLHHSLVACSDGSVASWGYNLHGALGNGTKTDSPIPVAVNASGFLLGRKVVSVAAGSFHSLALCSDGSMAGWGNGGYGQLGTGQIVYDGSLPLAVDRTKVLSGKDIVGICALRDRSGALCTDGTVAMWGEGEPGTLGNGRLEAQSFAPSLVAAATGIRSGEARLLAMGYSHALVIVDTPPSSRLSALEFAIGKLDPEFSPDVTDYSLCLPASATSTAVTPWTEDNPSTVKINGASVVAGTPSADILLPAGNETIAIDVTGEDGSVSHYNIQVTRSSNRTVVFHSASDTSLGVPGFDATGLTCDLTLDFDPAPGTELVVIRNTGIIPIVGNFTNLPQGAEIGLTHGARTYRFAVNYFGGTGNDLVLVWGHTEIKAWGSNNDGRLGDGTYTNRFRPVRVAETTAVADKVLIDLCSSGETVTLFADGSVAEWGGGTNLPAAVDLSGMPPDKRIVSVKAGWQHKLALCSDGSVWAWGSNGNGVLGVPGIVESAVPILVSDSGYLAGRKVIAIAAGPQFNMALCADGTVAAWGYNAYGQLGDGTAEPRDVPEPVIADGVLKGRVVTSISAGIYHAVVGCRDGTVVCWGDSEEGALGSQAARSCVPVLLPDPGFLTGRSVTSVSAGQSYAVVECSDGSIAAWGRNSERQLGRDFSSANHVPVEVPRPAGMEGTPVKALVAGASYVLADFSGSIVAWGSNGSGQLGRGTSTGSELPALVEGLAASPAGAVTLLAAGGGSFAGIGVPASSRLASLALDSGYYLSAFDPEDPTSDVVVAADSITLTPTTRNPHAVVSVNGSQVMSGTAGQVVPLMPGFNPVSVLVTAEDGSSTSYQLTVLRKTHLNAAFASAGDVPASVPFYDADGLTVNLSLAFVPSLGKELTVVENTGSGFIRGHFANLAQGQMVSLTYQGFVFDYVADYHGGSGNDLVLHWARRRLFSWGDNAQGQLGTGNTAQRTVPVDVSGMGALAGRTVLQVSAGSQHSLALCSDGTIAAWGANFSGQLGNGGKINSTVPVEVVTNGELAGKQVVAVSAAGSHSLALSSDGVVYAWGDNGYRQLGNDGAESSSVPLRVDTRNVPSGVTFVSICTGRIYSMALSSQGEVFTWGNHETLGRRGPQQYPAVVDLTGALYGRKVKSMGAGDDHSIVICEDGGIVGWGDSSAFGLTSTFEEYPVDIAPSGALAGTQAHMFAGGASHSTVLTRQGDLAAFGSNTHGQLGDGTLTNSSIPLEISSKGVLAGRTIKSIAAGDFDSMAVCDDGTLAVWGWNRFGQLGNGTTTTSPLPVDVSRSGAMSGCWPISVAAGPHHSLAIAAAPANSNLGGLSLGSWELNPAFSATVSHYFSQVHPETTSITMTPIVEDPLANVRINGVEVNSGTAGQGIPLVMGDNLIQIVVTANDATTTTYTINVIRPPDLQLKFDSETSVTVSAPWFIATGRAIRFSLDFAPVVGTNLMAVNNTGMGFIVGTFKGMTQGQAVEMSFGGKTYHFIANYYGGTGNDLVLEWANRSIASWGFSFVRLGDGTWFSRKLPILVDRSGILHGKTVVSIATSASDTVALCADGTVAQWTGLGAGMTGDAPPVQTNVPIQMSGTGVLMGKQVVSVATGNGTTIALCSDGTLAAWGYNQFGQLGDGTTSDSVLPVRVLIRGALVGKTVVSAAVGGQHCLVLCSDGTMVSWGQNVYGQLGKGNTNYGLVTDPAVQVLTTGVLAGRKVVAIGAGFDNSLALCSDGTLVSWGNGKDGRLGIASNSGVYPSPVLVNRSGVLADKTVASISVSAYNSAVVCTDGTVAVWGSNADGQLGSGTTATAYSPVALARTGALAGKTIVSVTAGDACMFATCSDGSVAAWGRNNVGQLGDGTLTGRRLPVLVDSSGDFHGKRVLSLVSGGSANHSHAMLAEPDDGFIAWMSKRAGVSNKMPSGDSDQDGIPNLLEYVLNGDPAAPSTTILPATTGEGGHHIFRFNRLATSGQDTVQIFQYSSDLITWNEVPIADSTAGQVVVGPADGSANQEVTVTIPRGDGMRMFGRLEVRRP